MSAADELRWALDPAAFFGRHSLEPDPWQSQVLRERRSLLLNCSRQSGKSTIMAAKALHRLVYRPGSTVLMIAPSERQSKLLFRKALAFAKDARVVLETETALGLALPSGSSLYSLPGSPDSIRGFSAVSLILFDEAAYGKDETYTAIRPMLAVSGGQIVLASSPNGRRGFFYEAWKSESTSWAKFEVTADECPRITQDFLEQEREELGERVFRQEYYCEFNDAMHAVFKEEDVEALASDEVEAWDIAA